MNINEAKEEIRNTFRAYHEKDGAGNYRYPRRQQRPLLLMGPPGVGKTAVLEQLAVEEGLGLVCYTMTHHTRQSALGLPRIEERSYAGKALHVTEYTMSEIVAEVYACMERSGCREGILFLDEINCVSETLAPAMLQLLQNKSFGTHAVPQGWMIVAAGNPPAYNKSVREYDIATLDRVRCIDVEPDCAVWLDYAREKGVHPAVLSYLTLRPEHFYAAENTPEGKKFVTARGWEDLSTLMCSYERLGIPVTPEILREFIQKAAVADGFYAYYSLFRRYKEDYRPDALLDDTPDAEERTALIAMARAAGWEERFTLVSLLADAVNARLEAPAQRLREQRQLREALRPVPAELRSRNETDMRFYIDRRAKAFEVRKGAGLITAEESRKERRLMELLRECREAVCAEHPADGEAAAGAVERRFRERGEEIDRLAEKEKPLPGRVLRFVKEAWGEGAELQQLLAALCLNRRTKEFMAAYGCEEFLACSGLLLFEENEETLRDACRKTLE